MIDIRAFQIFGFALVPDILLFYVLCSKEARVWLKPITFLVTRCLSPASRQRQRLPVNDWEESLFPIAPRFT
jgi:hypothetical protein